MKTNEAARLLLFPAEDPYIDRKTEEERSEEAAYFAAAWEQDRYADYMARCAEEDAAEEGHDWPDYLPEELP